MPRMYLQDAPPVAAMMMHFGGMVLLSWFVGVMAREGLLATTILLTVAVPFSAMPRTAI